MTVVRRRIASTLVDKSNFGPGTPSFPTTDWAPATSARATPISWLTYDETDVMA